jgi:predicted polyphosphate/ATP-dependent NAD kinase
MEQCVRLGFLVNPVAGIGGPLALKGSDGADARAAHARGVIGPAPLRSMRALAGLEPKQFAILTAAGAMGADAARAAGHAPQIVHAATAPSSGDDTIAAARALRDAGAQIIVFAGGDGTARDIMAAATGLPVLGIPAGVKMHSGVFAASPAAATAMLIAARDGVRTTPAEVIDRDADGQLRLHGLLAALAGPRRQSAKGLAAAADALLPGAIAEVAARLADEAFAIIGPGATMQAIKQALGGPATLLGVDVFSHGRCLAADVDEARLWQLLPAASPRLVLGVIGQQGFVLGRGNQIVSPRILGRIDRTRLTLVAGVSKLAALSGRLFVDTGDDGIDARLAGPMLVHTGRRRTMMMEISVP